MAAKYDNPIYFFNRTADGKSRWRNPVDMRTEFDDPFKRNGDLEDYADDMGHYLKKPNGRFKLDADGNKIYAGAAVTDFTTSIGWAGSPSSLNVTVIEEKGWETPLVFPNMGTPHQFKAGDFIFNGILKSVTRNESPSGGIKYSVTMESPNAILDGSQIITDTYSVDLGSVSNGWSNYPSFNFGNYTKNPNLKNRTIHNLVPNILNVFKLYESAGHTFFNPHRPSNSVASGFGQSWNNSQGMRWVDVIWGLMYLTGGYVVKTNDFNDILACGDYTGIGGGLYFGDYTYEVDFSGLADLSSSLGNGILPDNYRTSGPTSIMGLIQDLCDAASADFFIELQDDLYTISVKTINRTAQPQLGTIESYVQYGKSLNTVASCQVGEAWANNTMGKMVVGDSQTRMIQETAAHQIYGFQNVPGVSS